jgi:hypothetical protein
MVSEPVLRFFFQSFQLRRREATLSGEEEDTVVIRETVIDGGGTRCRFGFFWREWRDVDVEEGRGLLVPGGCKEFLAAQTLECLL